MKKTRFIAVMGLMLALASALQFLEGMIPIPLPLGVKPGISSIVVMVVLVKFGFASAMTIAVLKSGFVFITRGAAAFCMSVSGGVLSVAVMGVFLAVTRKSKNGTGILPMSVLGGVFHNIGQLAAASVFMGSVLTLSYLPVLVIAGIISGAFTGTVFKLIVDSVTVDS